MKRCNRAINQAGGVAYFIAVVLIGFFMLSSLALLAADEALLCAVACLWCPCLIAFNSSFKFDALYLVGSPVRLFDSIEASHHAFEPFQYA